jgi:hypothetical protein
MPPMLRTATVKTGQTHDHEDFYPENGLKVFVIMKIPHAAGVIAGRMIPARRAAGHWRGSSRCLM